MAKYNAKEVIDLAMTDETVYDDSEDEEFDGYISDSEVIRIIGLDMEMGECSKENENETENNEMCEGGNGVEINDGEINMDIEDIEDMEVGTMEDVASDIFEFVGQPERTKNMSNKSPIKFFDLLVTEQMFEEIAEQINLYANQHFEEHPDIAQRSRLYYWTKKAHTATELLQFFA